MKKIFSFIITIMVISFVGIRGVKADTVNVTQSFIDGVWSFHYRNGSVWTYGNLPFNYVDGNLVYCIQPDARITTNTYNVYSDFTMSGYSDDVRREMELISYYGYGYEGHTSLEYYMATQELLWLYSNDESIKWTVGDTDDTPMIDVSNEKNEILRLVNSHNILPSFSSSIFEINKNEELVLEDTNNTLDKYDISSPSGVEIERNGNIIKFKGVEVGNFILYFYPKSNYNERTYIYDDFSTRTQTLASFGKPDLLDFNVTIKVNPLGVININKTNENEENLKGVEFEIYDENWNLVEKLETNDSITSSKELNLGKYYVKETKELYGYEKNENIYEVNLDSSNNEDLVKENLDIVNKKIKCLVTYISGPGVEVGFNIYDSNNNIIYNGKTINGEASVELEYGDYIIKETSISDGYILNEEEIKFTVNDISCVTQLKKEHKKVDMPITSKESNLLYLLVLLFDIGGYVFIKKTN